MGVTLKLGRDGKPRRHWYGDIWIDGKRHVVNLAVVVQGKIPLTSSEKRDPVFVRSRKAAQKALAEFAIHGRQKGRAEHLTERLIEIKTGRSVDRVAIADLADRWFAMPREGGLTKAYASGIRSTCKRFRDFMKSRKKETEPAAVYLYEVTQADAGLFVERLRGELSDKSAREYTNLLRSAFRRFLPPGFANPFDGIVTHHSRDTAGNNSIHRKPFSAEELTNLFKFARGDAFLHPLVVAAACTGMRRGDVCSLKWKDVDLNAGMVTVKTSKTGAQVEIPIFPPFRAVLEAARRRGEGEYVFPAAAEMISKNAGGLTWRFKSLVARAFTKEEPKAKKKAPPPDLAVVLAEGLAAIDRMPEGERRDHTRETFKRYMAGDSGCKIAKETGVSKGSVSGWLSDVSGMIGKPVVRGSSGNDIKVAIAKLTRVDREKGHGQRAASVRDWHALRSTWVTLALTAGVPMELVRRVTGHATVDVVLKHYFRPGREEFRAVLAGALPDVLTGRKSAKMTPKEELKTLGKKLADGSATEQDTARLQKLIELV